MKKISILSLAAIMFLMINNTNLNNAHALETNTTTSLNLEQSSNNIELIGGMATTNCYTYYSNPTFNSEALDHDLTRINIDNLQKYISVNTNLSTNASQIDETILNSNITEYTCSAPFDTLYQLNLNTTTSNFVNYSTSYNLPKGTLTDGVISDLQTDDSNYIEIDSTEYNYFASSVSTNTAGGLKDETLAPVSTPDLTFISDDHWIQINDPYESYPSLSFGFTAIGSATYKIVAEVRYSTSGTPTTNKVVVKNAAGAISYEEIVSSSNDWYTYTFYVESNGISEISFVKYQSTMTSLIRVDYLYVEKSQKSEIDLSFFSNAIDSINNLATNVVLNLQTTSAIAYNFYINSVLQDTTGLDSFKNFTFTISTNNSVNLSLISVENTYSHFDIAIDFLHYYFTPNPVRNVTGFNFTYEINSIQFSQNITLKLDSFTGNHTNTFLVYSFDSSILSEYDHVSDLFIPNATQLFVIDLISDISFNISYFLEYSTSEWIVPSETNLKCNDIEISDDSYKSGFVTFVDYQNSLNFTANDDILFNFTILSTFSFELNLDVISKTYLSKSLVLSNYHAINLVTVEYLFDSDIKHSYLNNVDYSTAKSLYPSLNLDPTSSLKIEVIIDDTMYLELEKLNRFANSSSILTVKSRATGLLSNVGTSDIQFNLPMNMQLEQLQLSISNIRYIQNYIHSEYDIYNTYAERQDYPQLTKFQTSNRDSYNHTENATSSDYFEYQANPIASKFQTSNRDSYNHTENATQFDMFENQTIPTINQHYTTNTEFKANYTLYTSEVNAEIQSYNITPIGIVNSRTNFFEQNFYLPDDKMYSNITAINLTLTNNTHTWAEPAIAYKYSMYDFETVATTPIYERIYGITPPPVNATTTIDPSLHRTLYNIAPTQEIRQNINLGTEFEASWFCKLPSINVGVSYHKFQFTGVDGTHTIQFGQYDASHEEMVITSPGGVLQKQFGNYFNSWIHVRCVINSSSINVYINSTLIKSVAISTTVDVTAMNIITSGNVTTPSLIFDNLDFSIDESYFPNRNAKEIYIRDNLPQHGHYQGALSFDNDTINIMPENCAFGAYVIKEYQNHSKVLNMSQNYENAQINIDIEDFAIGNLEFYINFESIPTSQIDICRFTSLDRTLYTNPSQNVYYWNGSTQCSTGFSISLNHWYHIRLEIDSISLKFYFDNLLIYSHPYTDTITRFNSAGYGTHEKYYLDAIDYSSSCGFYQNRNCELNHTEAIYEIIANSNYNHTGHNQGAYSFDSDIVNRVPTGFTQVGGGYAFPIVKSEFNNHKKVMQFFDNDSSTYARAYTSFINTTELSCEFWIATNDSTKYTFWQIGSTSTFDTSTMASYLDISSGSFHVYNGSSLVTLGTCTNNQWYHFRLKFTDATKSFIIYINGTNLGTFNHRTNQTTIRYFSMMTSSEPVSVYLDALDFSWSPNYFVNRNTLENQSTSLETWNAYPNWEHNEFKNSQDTVLWGTSGIPTNVIKYGTPTTYEISNFSNHLNVINITSDASSEGFRKSFTNATHYYFSFYIYPKQTNKWITVDSEVSGGYAFGFACHSSGYLYTYNGSAWLTTSVSYTTKWYHVIIDATSGSTINFYVDNYLIATRNMTRNQGINQIRLISDSIGGDFYADALTISSTISNCYLTKLENTTYSMLAMNYTAAPRLEPTKNYLSEGSYIYQYTIYNATNSMLSDVFSFSILSDFVQSPYLSVGFEFITQCGTNATFSIFAEQSIFNVHLVKAFDTISNINSTLGITDGTYLYNVYSNISQLYNVTFYVEDTGGYFRSHTIENLFFAKNQTYLNLDYSKMLYQRAEFNITTILTQSIYNLNENRTISISYPNSTIFTQTNNSISSKLDYTTGYFSVNITYPGSDQFLSCSILRVFEVISAPTPSISVSYSESINVGESNVFNISISKTLYDLENGNFTFGSSNYVESLDSTADNKCYSIVYNVTTIYNAILYVNDSEGFWTQINLSNLFVAKNQTFLNIDYSKMLYQRAEFNITTNLTQSIYNLNENRTITIGYPNSSLFEQSNNSISSKLDYTTGYFAINVSYPGSDQFLSCSILRVFEVISAPTPSLSISYSEKVNVGEANLFNISISKTLYNLEFGNFTLGSSNYVESLDSTADNKCYSIVYNVTTIYNTILYVNDSEGFWTQINLSNLFVMKNSSMFTFANLYRSYYQNSTVNVSTSLERNVTIKIYSIYDVLLQTAINQSILSIGWNYSGYYRITAEFNDTTNQYLNYSVETYFEVLPLSRIIELSQTVHLSVNSTSIINNSITISNLNSSFILSFVADSITTFDLSIVYVMNYTTTVSMLSTSLAEFQFRANTNISSIEITNMTLQNYPSPFSNFITQGSISENYSISENVLQMTDFINQTLLNNDELTYGFVMFGDNSKFQLDSAISTKDSSVRFREYGLANRTFNNWYIDCSDVNSPSITQLRTSIEPTLTNSGNSYYFSTSTIANDIFECDWSLDPSWVISSQIIENNGTFIQVQVEVESNFDLENVTVYFINPVYYSNWSNATQDYYSKEVAFFTERISSGTNTFYLNATREVPFANLWYFGSQVNVFLYPNSTQTPAYYAYLQYPEYSEVWEIIPESDWILDGVHYMNRSYTLENNTFFCEGFDSSITSSFLYFAANPLNSFDVAINETSEEITLTIDLNLPMNSTVIMFPVNISGNFDIKTRGITELYELDGVTWFMFDDPVDLDPGVTTIIISYEIYSLKNSWWYAIPLMAILFGVVWWYLDKQRKEKGLPSPSEKKNLGLGDKK